MNYIQQKWRNVTKKICLKILPLPSHSYPGPARLDKRKDLKCYNIGEYCWGHLTVSDTTNGNLKIGKFCSFAYNVQVLLGGEHRGDWLTTYRFPAYPFFEFHSDDLIRDSTKTRGHVIIGNDVWIGQGCLILSGVTIGDGVIVGAGSVVRRDIPPYTIAYGNPARPVAKRFPDEIIDEMLQIKWWDWDIKTIEKALPLLLSGDYGQFVRKYGTKQKTHHAQGVIQHV